ncbi:TM2 domain-containing protein [Roseococcus suduntuyensis]|uniref:TM2 domain-containing membrane protein YozV n=2 Tax=Roseococcus suduntuyensis TaxID=455361 RepID=A0A840AIX6_9PROT|nr:TM2 domain-containing protein [Roseococcus suduntuyensis]MBB3900420.1 TM2 domain-containing membrane protein YozV [Roseococcus suduntuyensis]
MPPRHDDYAAMRYHANAKSLVAAYLIWFFLGYGGIHRMYLGRWVSGLVMLGVFVMSWVLSLVFIGYIGLGFILVWWALDALLMPGLVSRSNEALIRRLSR